jgi:hypothetical protein
VFALLSLFMDVALFPAILWQVGLGGLGWASYAYVPDKRTFINVGMAFDIRVVRDLWVVRGSIRVRMSDWNGGE